MKSFIRVRSNGLAELFYESLLKGDSRIAALFKNTDFKRQKDLVILAVVMLIDYYNSKPLGEMAIKHLGELHSRKRMNITPDLYSIWIDAMIALTKLNPEFSPDLERQWREVIRKGISVMVQMSSLTALFTQHLFYFAPDYGQYLANEKTLPVVVDARPAATICPSVWRTIAIAASLPEPKEVTIFPPVPKVVSIVPSAL